MRNKLLSCLRYNLKKLLASPVTYLVIVLTILFVDREILPVRNYLRDTGTLVSWPGLLTYLLDYAPLTLLMGLAVIALLSPLPMTDEAQVYIMVRSGRRSWAQAQVAMVFVVCVLLHGAGGAGRAFVDIALCGLVGRLVRRHTRLCRGRRLRDV